MQNDCTSQPFVISLIRYPCAKTGCTSKPFVKMLTLGIYVCGKGTWLCVPAILKQYKHIWYLYTLSISSHGCAFQPFSVKKKISTPD